MPSPIVLVNNLVQEEDSYVDPLSKTFIILDLLIGLNRIAVLGKISRFFKALASIYSLFLFSHVVVLSYVFKINTTYAIVVGIDAFEFLLCVLISTIIWKRLQLYFNELQKFDEAVGCRPKVTAASIKNVIQMSISIVLTMSSIPYEIFVAEQLSLTQMGVRLIHILEVHFYGHLLSLLVPRLRLINYYMKISLNDCQQVEAPKVEKLPHAKANNLESQNCQMENLMELYCIITSAYDLLIEAIKWQFLVALTSSFISVLSFSYLASLMIIRGTRSFAFVMAESAFTAVRLLPIFSPCLFGDQVHDEVRRLRELLASRLYENKLNKSGRSVARALLALTEARNLSFSLLQIFDIDISLPFKFMGLLLHTSLFCCSLKKILILDFIVFFVLFAVNNICCE